MRHFKTIGCILSICFIGFGCGEDPNYSGSATTTATSPDSSNSSTSNGTSQTSTTATSNSTVTCSETTNLYCSMGCSDGAPDVQPVCNQGEWVCPAGSVNGNTCDDDCSNQPQPMCVEACGDDYFMSASCTQGNWVCPSNTTNIDDCAPGTCWGPPGPSCCDGSSPECNGGNWNCSGIVCHDNTLTGEWAEVARIDCDDEEITYQVEDPVAELIFISDGTFKLTFASGLFETFVHYWGSYSNSESGALSMHIDSGNYLPEDFDGEGLFTFDEETGEERITIRDIWFGQPYEEAPLRTCGYIMTR